MDTIANDKTKQIKDMICGQNSIIENELIWFKRQIERKVNLDEDNSRLQFQLEDPPSLDSEESEYATTVKQLKLNKEERALLMLAFAPERAPEILEPLYCKYNKFKFQIVRGMNLGLPTPETFIQLMAGDDLQKKSRFKLFICS